MNTLEFKRYWEEHLHSLDFMEQLSTIMEHNDSPPELCRCLACVGARVDMKIPGSPEYNCLLEGVFCSFPRKRERVYVVDIETKDILATETGSLYGVGSNEIVSRIYEELHNGKRLLIAHNHCDDLDRDGFPPYEPSNGDMVMASKFDRLASRLEIPLPIHLIVTHKSGIIRYDENGILSLSGR